MKHLTYFNEGLTNQYQSSVEEVYNDLKDIVIELQHEGFKVFVGNPDYKQDTVEGFRDAYLHGYAYDISICKLVSRPIDGAEEDDEGDIECWNFLTPFRFGDVYETLLRLQDYLKQMGHRVTIHACKREVKYQNKIGPMYNCDELGTKFSGYLTKNSNIFSARLNIMFMPQYESHINESYNRQDLIEILYDLTDDKGFVVDFKGDYDIIVITKSDNDSFILNNEVMDAILRVVEYLGDDFERISVKSDDRWQRYYPDSSPKVTNNQLNIHSKHLSDLPRSKRINIINILLNVS